MTNTADLPDEDLVPEWDLADRLAKSLRERDLSVAAMAEAFDVSRQTIGRWVNGRGVPTRVQLHFWAILTGVNEGWLTTGTADTQGVPAVRLYAIRDSNPEPADMEPRSGLPRFSIVKPTLTPERRDACRPRHLSAVAS